MANEKPEKQQAIPQVVWAGNQEVRYQSDRPTPQPEAAQPPNQPLPQPQRRPQTSKPAPQAETTRPRSENGDTATGYTPPSEQARALAHTVVSSLVDRLAVEARRLGGYLTMRDIDRLSDEFRQKTEELQKVFQISFDQYVRARERAAVDHARQYPFDRIIVNTFAHLFDADRVADDGEHAVTRNVLPGFFIALDKMLGEDEIARFQRRAGAIIARLSPASEKEIDWYEVYADPEANRICLDALAGMSPYFADYHRRQAWFLRLVNGAVPADADWELTDWGFYNLVESLFLPLRVALDSPDRRPEMEERYGGVACFNMDKMFETMDKAGGRED